jgi:hypothetical protein
VSKAMSRDESISSSVVSGGIEKDLENARVLLEDKPWCDSPQKYRKTAETIILRILKLDPRNTQARALLAKARVALPGLEKATVPVPELEKARIAIREMEQQASPPPVPAGSVPVPQPVSVRDERETKRNHERLVFSVQPPKPRRQRQERKSRSLGLVSIAAIVVIAGLAGFLLLGTKGRRNEVPKTVAAASPVRPAPPAVSAIEPQPQPQPPNQPIPAGASSKEVVQPKPEPVAVKSAPPVKAPAVTAPAAPAPAPTAPAAAAPAPAPAPTGTGMLSVVSFTAVDIYVGGRLAGSAPVTLRLPAGVQKIEYRHEGLRKTAFQEIRPNETATAVVTFDIPVHINANPSAMVSIEGSSRRALGQTPIREVRVPVGSMLLFENPNYPSKTYRVTGREKEIRVSFTN